VDFNSRVTNGQVIARIDPSTYDQVITQSEAELANVKAALELAELNQRRNLGLFTNGLVPAADYDKSVVELHQAQATVKMREAVLKKGQVDLERTTILSPIDGIVISRNVDVGQTVAASFNTPTLFTIANDLRNMRIEAMVSEADVGGVTEGQRVTFTVDAFPGRPFRGHVTQVRFAPVTNQNVVTYTTVVEVNNDELKLRPGMTANTQIITAERKDALKIPNAALRFRPPAGAIVRGDTNHPAGLKTVSSGAKPEIATSGPFAGLPTPPWMTPGERRRPTEQERADYEATLTPEQKQKYQQIMSEMRARFAQRGDGGGSGGGGPGFGGSERRRAEPEGPRTQTIYLVEKESVAGQEQLALRPVTVKLGISDGANTEVIDGVKDGDVVASGMITQASATPAAGGSPFGGSPFGGPRIR
jgi:HlyD family secretion protein